MVGMAVSETVLVGESVYEPVGLIDRVKGCVVGTPLIETV